MTDRERLIKLLGNFNDNNISFCDICDRPKEDCDSCMDEQLADYLLEHGVICLPCKVGDMVYLPWDFNGVKSIAYLTVTHIIFDTEHNYVKTDFYTDDEAYYDKYKCGRYEFEDFGKIVFLTYEEAERALKERENNG